MSESSTSGNNNRLAVEAFEVFRDTPLGLARIEAAYDLKNPNTSSDNLQANAALEEFATGSLENILKGTEPDIDTAIEAVEWWHRTYVTQKVGRHTMRLYAQRQNMEVAAILHGAIITATKIDFRSFGIARQPRGLRSTDVHTVTGSFEAADTKSGTIFLKDPNETLEPGNPNRPGPGEFWHVPFMIDGTQTANITITGNIFQPNK